jgi:exosortase
MWSRFPSAIFFLLPLAGYWLVLIYYLGAQWSVYEQYNYGWAVPFLCLYLAWRKAESGNQKAESTGVKALAKVNAEKVTSGNTEIQGAFNFSTFQLFSFCLLCLLYAPTRFLHEANPTWRLTSLLWTLEVIGLTLLVMRLALGTRRWAQFVFPICFFLVAVPWPSGLENLLTQSLMRLNAATTVELLGMFGVPAVQHGNVIEIGRGMVGIDEACSGIRSFQATLMISLFLGEVYALSAKRRALCVFAGFALAFLFNVGRTLLLTRVAAAKGVGAVASWHDPAGVTILVACFLCLWLIARAVQKAESGKQKVEIGVASAPSSKLDVGCSMLDVPPEFFQLPTSIFHLRSLSVALLAWLILVEAGVEVWYRSHERTAVDGTGWSVQTADENSTYRVVEIPPSVSGQFKSDKSLQARWQDGSGNSWQLYYFRWFPGRSLQKRVTIQLAKVHGPEVCLPAAGMSLKAYLGIIKVPLAGMDLAMQQYVFNAEGTPLHVFYGIYEDSSGSTELANRRKDTASRLAAPLAGSRNYGQRFLEVAVFGYEKPEEAEAALTRELKKVIKVEK